MINKAEHKIAYSIAEVAQKTTLSKSFLRLEIKREKLKARRFGSRVIVLHDDLQNYLNASIERV